MRPTSPRARSSSTERESSLVRACTSSNSRAFSMAITAWSAKVRDSSICLSVKGLHFRRRRSAITPISSPLATSVRETAVRARSAPECAARCSILWVGLNVGNVNRTSVVQRLAPRTAPRVTGSVLQMLSAYVDGAWRATASKHLPRLRMKMKRYSSFAKRVRSAATWTRTPAAQFDGRARDDPEHLLRSQSDIRGTSVSSASASAPPRTAARSRSRSPPGRRRW